MPKIEGYHPVCLRCGDDNETPRYKWCPDCRAEERARKGKRKPDLVNPCGMSYVETVRAGDSKDALPDGMRVGPGHALGWYELI